MFEHENEVFDISARVRYNRAIGTLHQRMEAETMAVKQTAGRDQLGTFAPKFAQLNDDVLFGEVWSREDKLSLRDRSLVTVVSQIGRAHV